MGSEPEENHFVSLADIGYFMQRSKRKMIFCSALLALCGFFWAVTSPVEYIVTASFKEHSKSPVNTSLMSAILISGAVENDNASAAIALMNSKRIIGELVKKEGLQAVMEKQGIQFGKLETILNNLWTEYALWTNRQGLILSKAPNPVIVQQVQFAGEMPLQMVVRFLTEETFQVVGKDGATIAGQLGESLNTPQATFILVRKTPGTIMGQEYALTILPLEMTIAHESKKFSIEPDRDDKALLKIRYRCQDRHQGVECVNTLMALYQNYLRNDQKRILSEQVDYLHVRQDQMQEKLQKMMDAHAAILSADAVSTGFLNSSQAMEFLAGQIQAHSQRLLAIDLELKGFAKAEQEGVQALEKWTSQSDNVPFNDTLARLRALQQQADSLEIALNAAKKELNPVNFTDEITSLEKAQQRSEDAVAMLSNLREGRPIVPSHLLLEDPQYMIREWCSKLDSSRHDQKTWNHCASNFITYLSNLTHLFHVQAKTIQERLRINQNGGPDFPGLDLASAKGLYIDYSRQLDNNAASLIQYKFVLEQMLDPDFEISALSTVLTDSVSKEIIAEASKEQLAMKDQNNRSPRELERIQYDLSVHKKFLETHLNQAKDLQLLNKEFLEGKVLALQRATLQLTHQEISVLREHLADLNKKRIEFLTQERETLLQHQKELQQEIAKWPTQWVSEMLIEQQMDINKRMVEEVTKLVESRNISSNIEVIQSTPVDVAMPPLQPKSPRIAFAVLFCALLGAILPLAWNLIRSMAVGMPITMENLRLANKYVAGSFSREYDGSSAKPPLDHDLNTLRHIVAFLDQCAAQKNAPGNTLLLVNGGHPDYARDLGTLLAKKGLKVIRIPLAFEKPGTPQELPGLLQYLEGKAAWPQVLFAGGQYFIAPGGISRFANELTGSHAFKALLAGLQKEYDWIILSTPTNPNAAETQNLLQHVDDVMITISNQTWHDIQSCLNAKKATGFVFSNGEL